MKARVLALTSLLTVSIAAAQPSREPIEALDGVDTVILLTQGKEVFGKQDFRSVHGRFAYLFSTAETKTEFDKAPGKYAIQSGGVCARMGKTVSGNPSDYLVHDGRIYIFGSDACRKAFASAPSKFLPKPAPPMPADPAAVSRGRALLEKAVQSLGGATLDALTSYVEAAAETQQRPSGEVKITTTRMWNFPGAVRTERTVAVPNRPTMTFGTLLTPGGAWGVGGSGASPVIPEGLPSVQQDLWRQLVPLLRSRGDEGTAVAALDPATVDGISVERVRVRRGGLDVTVNLDRSAGRVHSTTFVDRNRDGEIGEFTLLYSDFRQVDGVMIPFVEKALFNGQPDPSLTRTIESVAVNSPLDPALFGTPR